MGHREIASLIAGAIIANNPQLAPLVTVMANVIEAELSKLLPPEILSPKVAETVAKVGMIAKLLGYFK